MHSDHFVPRFLFVHFTGVIVIRLLFVDDSDALFVLGPVNVGLLDLISRLIVILAFMAVLVTRMNLRVVLLLLHNI